MGLLLEGLIPTPILAEPPCAVCGRVASHVELVEPSERPAWTLIFSGVVAGNGSGRDIDAEEAGRIAFAFTQPYSSARIRVADLYDDAGFCGRCGVFYCAGHWRASSSGYGTCPNEHGKSLDPHWSPDF
ncbi:MAG: hypothetical protein ACRDH7_07975 [Actinomycetota bacterium]